MKPEKLKLKPDARIVSADFSTGERFLFDYDGARLVKGGSVVFGKTDGGSFVTIPLAEAYEIKALNTYARVRMDDENKETLAIPRIIAATVGVVFLKLKYGNNGN